MFSWGELYLSDAPRISAASGVTSVTFGIESGSEPIDPVLRIGGADAGTVPMSAVLRHDLLSLSLQDDDRRVSVFPDGRILVSAGDLLFQDVPGRRGAQIRYRGTQLTITAEEDVLVVGADFALVVGPDGSVRRIEQSPPAAPGVTDGPALPGENVLPFPRKDDGGPAGDDKA